MSKIYTDPIFFINLITSRINFDKRMTQMNIYDIVENIRFGMNLGNTIVFSLFHLSHLEWDALSG
jgi:hypothetical protein